MAVVIPAGPDDDVLDTLASVVHYTDTSRVVVVVDDTRSDGAIARAARELSPDIAVIPAPSLPLGWGGTLWVKVAEGYHWALERYEPDLILRLDADALLIGHGLQTAAERAFAANPQAGLLGSYRIGPDGGLRDFSGVARTVRSEAGLRGAGRPRYWSSLRGHLRRARLHGYSLGESVLGGAYIHSRPAARAMFDEGHFRQPWLAKSKLGEDHIMAILTMATGYRMLDFGGPADPMALRWRGLPGHPEDLLAAGKLATHSVRSWQELGESEIRAIFAQARAEDRSRMG